MLESYSFFIRVQAGTVGPGAAWFCFLLSLRLCSPGPPVPEAQLVLALPSMQLGVSAHKGCSGLPSVELTLLHETDTAKEEVIPGPC